MKFLIEILQFRKIFGESLGKILFKSAKKIYDLARSCHEFKRKTDKSERKQAKTKTEANFCLISVPVISQLFALPTKLSRSEFQYFVLFYSQ